MEMENNNIYAEDYQSRKFVLWFESKSEDFNDDRLLTERARCKAFWEFVDSQPNLKSLVKKGEPIYTASTTAVKPDKNKNNRKVDKNEVKVKASTTSDFDDYEDCRRIEEARGLLLRTKHHEQRMRIARQREKTLELERKSGQKRPKARTMERKTPSWKVLSDISEGRESIIMTAYKEMSSYDEVKNVNKKPSKSNTISQITELDTDHEETTTNSQETLKIDNEPEPVQIEEIFLKNSVINSTES